MSKRSDAIKRRVAGARGVLVLAVYMCGCASLPGVVGLKLLARKSRPFVILQADERKGWGRASHVFLCRVSERRIAMTYWVAGDGAQAGVAPVPWPYYSDDGGLNWQAGDPYLWLDGPPTNQPVFIEKNARFSNFENGYFFASTRLPSGIRVAHGRRVVSQSDGRFSLSVITSEDGLFWSGPRQAPLNIPREQERRPDWLIFEGKAACAPDGRILSVAYGPLDQDKTYSTVLIESRDGGISYEMVSSIASPASVPWSSHGPAEPALALLPNGELLVVMRTGGGWSQSGTGAADPLLAARSSDGGRTWEYRKLPISGVMPKLELMSDGTLVLAVGRPGNNLYFSRDNGRTWGRQVQLSPPDIRTSGYCDVLEVAPGRLLAVYDAMNTDLNGIWAWEPREVNAILGVFVDVKEIF